MWGFIFMKRYHRNFIVVAIKAIGIMVACICILRVLVLASDGYKENFEDIVLFFFVALVGYVFFLFGDYVQEMDRIQRGIDAL